MFAVQERENSHPKNQRTSQVIRIFSWVSKNERKSRRQEQYEWMNQTCKNLIRFLQDRISNKRSRRWSSEEATRKFSFMIIQIKLMIFCFLPLLSEIARKAKKIKNEQSLEISDICACANQNWSSGQLALLN